MSFESLPEELQYHIVSLTACRNYYRCYEKIHIIRGDTEYYLEKTTSVLKVPGVLVYDHVSKEEYVLCAINDSLQFHGCSTTKLTDRPNVQHWLWVAGGRFLQCPHIIYDLLPIAKRFVQHRQIRFTCNTILKVRDSPSNPDYNGYLSVIRPNTPDGKWWYAASLMDNTGNCHSSRPNSVCLYKAKKHLNLPMQTNWKDVVFELNCLKQLQSLQNISVS